MRKVILGLCFVWVMMFIIGCGVMLKEEGLVMEDMLLLLFELEMNIEDEY